MIRNFQEVLFQVPKDKDETLEKEFNKLLEASSYLSHNLDFNKVNGSPLSLGFVLELIIKLQEKHVKQKQIDFYIKLIDLQLKLKETIQKVYSKDEF